MCPCKSTSAPLSLFPSPAPPPQWHCPLHFPFQSNGLSVLFTSWIKVFDPALVFPSWFFKHFSGNCGSCWAIGTGGSLADRLCIASNASKVRSTVKAPLSILCLPKHDTCCYLMFPFSRRFWKVALPTKRSSAVIRFLQTKHA